MESRSSASFSRRFTSNEENTNVEEIRDAEINPLPKFKRALSQYCATLASSFLTLTMGMAIGFSTILVNELLKKDAEIVVTLEELTWLSSINNILITIGAIFSGMLAQLLGRRRSIMILTIPYIVSWIILHYATESGMLFVALTLIGFTGGLAESPIQTYVAEISEPMFRGSLSATISMMMMIGVFLQFLIGRFVYWRILVLINLICPVGCLLAMFAVPESPHWLASKHRFSDTEQAISWLRGWTTPSRVRHETQVLFEETSISLELITAANPEKQTTNKKQLFVNTIKPYLKRTVYLPFAIVSFSFFVSCFNGSTPILTFAIIIFKNLDSPIDEYTATIIMGFLKVFGSLILIFLIRYCGKRKLVFVSLIGTGLSLTIVSIYIFARDYYQINNKTYSWIPTAMVLFSVFASTIGIKGIPWIISGEVFQTDVRSVANGMVCSTYNIYAAIANKSFLYMVSNMTFAGTFFFFTCINFIGLIIIYFILPETEGKSLKEIGNYYDNKKVKKSKMIKSIN